MARVSKDGTLIWIILRRGGEKLASTYSARTADRSSLLLLFLPIRPRVSPSMSWSMVFSPQRDGQCSRLQGASILYCGIMTQTQQKLAGGHHVFAISINCACSGNPMVVETARAFWRLSTGRGWRQGICLANPCLSKVSHLWGFKSLSEQVRTVDVPVADARAHVRLWGVRVPLNAHKILQACGAADSEAGVRHGASFRSLCRQTPARTPITPLLLRIGCLSEACHHFGHQPSASKAACPQNIQAGFDHSNSLHDRQAPTGGVDRERTEK